MPKKVIEKKCRFTGLKVTEDFLDKVTKLKEKYSFKSDTELVETAIKFFSLANDEKFKDMKVPEFLDIFLAIKKGL